MATTLARWRPGVFAPFDFGGLFPLFAPEIRVEEFIEDGQYVVRAEIPGVDPEKEVEVSVIDGTLKIHVERSEEKRDKAHSEFHYGRLMRSMPLPSGAMEDSAVAKYTNGILEISFKLGEARESGRRIPIEVPKGKGGKVRE